MAAYAGRCREVVFLVECHAVGAEAVGLDLTRLQSVSPHQRCIFVTVLAGCGDVRRIDVAAGVVGRQDRVRVVAVRAGRRVAIASFEQQVPVSTGAVLGQLAHRQTVLSHLVGVGVTRCTQADSFQLVGGPDVIGTGVRGRLLESPRIATMAVVTANASLRVGTEEESPAFLCVTDDATIVRIDGEIALLRERRGAGHHSGQDDAARQNPLADSHGCSSSPPSASAPGSSCNTSAGCPSGTKRSIISPGLS